MAVIVLGLAAIVWSGVTVPGAQSNAKNAFIRSLGTPTIVGSTVPANGDVNP